MQSKGVIHKGDGQIEERTSDWKTIICRLEQLLDKAEALLNMTTSHLPILSAGDLLDEYIAFRWRSQNGSGHLLPNKATRISLRLAISSAFHVKLRRSIGIRNSFYEVCLPTTFCFGVTAGRANPHSSKACFDATKVMDLRLVEVNRDGLMHLQEIADSVMVTPGMLHSVLR